MHAITQRLTGLSLGASGANPYSGYSLHDSSGIQVVLPEQGMVLGRATLLSPAAVWTQPGFAPAPLSHERMLRVCLDTGGTSLGPFKGEARWSDAGGRGSALGIQLVGVSSAQGRQILSLLEDALRQGSAEPEASPLPVQEEISDGERIESILTAISAMRNRGVLRRPGRTVRVALERLDSERGLVHWRCTEPGAGWGEAPYELELVGYNSAYRMRLEAASVDGDRMVTRLPEQLWRVRHRFHRRIPAPAGLRARFDHPMWRDLGRREREVVDLSFTGLGLSIDPGDLVFPGLFLTLELEMADGECIYLSGEVRHVSFAREDGRRLCGLEVRPRTERDAALWKRFVSQSLCPSTRTSETLLEPLWDLYDASGYFSLAGRSTEQFDELRRSFIDLGRRAGELPQLFCQTVWPSERGVEASLSSLKAYRHSWLIHQLGRRPGKPANLPPVPGQILRDTYQRTLEHAQGDSDFRWMVAYCESTVPWMYRTHVRFAQRLQDSGQTLVMGLRMMDAECNEPSGLPTGDLDIGPASIGEKYLLAREIARTRPAAYVESLDFTRERLEMWGISRTWQGEGLERERKIFVARRQGLPLAALVVELGHPGTNLFRLLDSARLFPLAPQGRHAYVALLDEARRWFAQRGRTAFVYLCEDDGAYAQAARLHDDPSAQPCLWIISASLIPEFLEHINEQSVGRSRSNPHHENSHHAS
ncbi:PilZ domain-containing protein [Vitiosangium sp. GDMCC 1.1324]|uniref:PilZ domain-containing protein n=1 Tax=Vitiosangium sp. (strain GDMCC 1.1324) TaxID=2138576 RepID=UPI000D3BADDB|nr:PilZ domain-containing protein [Vitiosangium sp. GDMCC 1.1324]PTL80463.1 hypothetical protein DAT35_27900 [Vitiosangium sp. GDMCC 1.1324]